MLKKIYATVLFVQDLEKCAAFYRDVLGLQSNFHDEVAYSFPIGDDYLHLLALSEAADLLQTDVSELASGNKPWGLLAVPVDDVHATYEELLAKGVKFLRPPVDQPWGLRTAHFTDPEGNVLEIHQSID